MSMHKNCNKKRINNVKSVHEVITQDIENNGWSVEGKFVLPDKTISAMEGNITKLPWIFTMDKRQSGQTSKTRYFEIDSIGRYVEIELSAKEENEINKSKDRLIIKIFEANGQMGPLDFMMYQYLEQYIYKYVMNNNTEVEPDKNVRIPLGTHNSFINGYNESLNKKRTNNDVYDDIEGFFRRLTGLVIFYIGKAYYIAKEKTNEEISERAKFGSYVPFREFTSDGEVNGKRTMWLELDSKYISNILYGHSKLIYNEFINGINQASSKYLFRILMLRDSKAVIPINYSELTQLMGITRHSKKALAKEQIGSFARGINNDKHGNLLVYASANDDSMFGKNFPFIMKDMKDKHDWQFLFCLNAYVTPEMHNYGVQTISRSIIEQKQSRLNEIYYAICDLASFHNMTTKEYLDWGLTAVSLARAFNVADNEMEDMKKRSRLKAQQHGILGKKAANLYGGYEPAMQALCDEKAVRTEQAADKKKDCNLPAIEQLRRGRGRPRNNTYSDIPF